MDLEYDRKLEEMKTYIPFLENMIKNLENTSSTSANPRQAQLDKIRSLRDLLLDKKKRMKMENLMKCEQVLVNLYAKMELRGDTLPGIKKASESRLMSLPQSPASHCLLSKKKPDLDIARNKLQSVVSTFDVAPRTLSDTTGISDSETSYTSSSKEPALFQRRPDKLSPKREESCISSENSPSKSVTKRNYTRVLVSPERNARHWTSDNSDKPLFTRRSDMRSPRQSSPSYKKERRKSSKQEPKSRQTKGLNIKLDVPEERLNSLNSRDMWNRIIKCNDKDADIDTLRRLKEQILGELRQTGAREDISEFILKSYSNKKKKKKKTKKKKEIEEGELSDSESEVIESVYGGLVVEKNNGKESTADQTTTASVEPRKIQICLAINLDKDKNPLINLPKDDKQIHNMNSELEIYEEKSVPKNVIIPISKEMSTETKLKNDKEIEVQDQSNTETGHQDSETKQIFDTNEDDNVRINKSGDAITQDDNINIKDDVHGRKSNTRQDMENVSEEILVKANFYKPLENREESNAPSHTNLSNEDECNDNTDISVEMEDVSNNDINLSNDCTGISNTTNDTPNEISDSVCVSKSNKSVRIHSKDSKENDQDIPRETLKSQEITEIPLLNLNQSTTSNSNIVSEIDILQALKNEILNETIPGTEISTPPLHQPKITKVANAQEISKKRISIEKYKEKAVSSLKNPLFLKDPKITKDDHCKKQSLKLTEKECERFNLLASKIAFDESSDDEDKNKSNISIEDIYGNLAPKSPDHEVSIQINNMPPVIIPADPVKTTVSSSITDVDMRKLMPVLSPNKVKPLKSATNTSLSQQSLEVDKNESKSSQNCNDKDRLTLMDPRVRRDINQSFKESPKPKVINPERTPLHPGTPLLPTPIINFPNMTPNMTPNARSFEMTPQPSFEADDRVNKKHVYAPIVPVFESADYRETSITRESTKPRWNTLDKRDDSHVWEDRDLRSTSTQKDNIGNLKRSRFHDYQHRPRNDAFNSDQRDDYLQNRQDCPQTPNHYFGRSECPPTPTNTFGRPEASMTPVHSFSRIDCPPTPSHPFGRSDHAATPIHSFGRSECPSTPSHPFGRLEMPMTPNHPFGRSDYSHKNHSNYSIAKSQDPRLNRNSDCDIRPQHYDDERIGRDISSRGNHKSDFHNLSYNNSDSYRINNREQSVGRNDRNKNYSYDQSNCHYNSDPRARRESSFSSSGSRDYESESIYTRHRNTGNLSKDKYERDRSLREVESRRPYFRDQSVGQSMSSDQNMFTRSSSRAPSINKYYHGDAIKENQLSVKSDAGRSFTIDTSVTRTFQELIENDREEISNSFYDRRKRASSVGRPLVRELSTVKATVDHPKSTVSTSYQRNDFRRAKSVGRDVFQREKPELVKEKSFKDIKADFEAYKLQSKNYKIKGDKRQETIEDKKKNDRYSDSRSRKDIYETQRDGKFIQKNKNFNYSPRKNNRDPRLHREKPNSNFKNRGNSLERNIYGIVYSNDNIARGKILGAGYGVKNYKIPKIKRVIEETETSDKNEEELNKEQLKEKEKEKLSFGKQNDREKDKIKFEKGKKNEKIKVEKEKQISQKSADKAEKPSGGDERITDVKGLEKRVTRSGKKSSDIDSTASESDISKIGKFKKRVIYDSDSEHEENKADTDKVVVASNTEDRNEQKNELGKPAKEKETEDKEIADTDFGIEDLEMFSENVASDSVIENINALIADLDNDLNTSKSDTTASQFTKEITLENMLESITNTEGNNETTESKIPDIKTDESSKSQQILVTEAKSCENNSYKDDFKIRLQQTDDEKQHKQDKIPSLDLSEKSVNSEMENSLSVQGSDEKNLDNSVPSTKSINEIIVSTTNVENEPSVIAEKFPIRIVHIADNHSAPDSTIDTEQKVQGPEDQRERPDSTNEMQNEMNPVISSTHDTSLSKVLAQPSTCQKELVPQMDSIGSLLSILQDKSKIKELLSMLGDNSNENEKIKKKLEKLSEIVSDDEDTKDESVGELETTTSVDKKEVDEKNCSGNKVETTYHTENLELHDGQNTILDTSNKNENVDIESDQIEKTRTPDNTKDSISKPNKMCKKLTLKRGKHPRKLKGKAVKSAIPLEEKRITRSEAAILQVEKGVTKKIQRPSRELKQLQEDIKEMFLSDDILNATGIRMCRLAKLVDEKTSTVNPKDSTHGDEPVVLLEKFKDLGTPVESLVSDKPVKKKPGPKPKSKTVIYEKKDGNDKTLPDKTKTSIQYKPGPKSKTKVIQKNDDVDPYLFESDSVSETNIANTKTSEKNSSDSESDSLASSKSFESNELLVESKKKPKRKRRGWQVGVIKSKNRKKKVEPKHIELLDDDIPIQRKPAIIPDMKCFTDKTYCFLKNVTSYFCRLCEYKGTDIVHHYKKQHPHSEIPLSRMSPQVAKEAIEQCEQINFQAISKIQTDKYICRFCFKEFVRKKAVLETFFWHVVSMHTGEYKQLCSECINVTRCPFNLDIPPPPKDVKGQLIGYICGKCYFTQISLENLKTHVIIRHNDEQTEVYTINLAMMSKKTLNFLSKSSALSNQAERTRVLRSSRSNNSVTDASDDHESTDSESPLQEIVTNETKSLENDNIKFQSKITFETDDSFSEVSNVANSEDSVKTAIKEESEEQFEGKSHCDEHLAVPQADESNLEVRPAVSDDILAYPHFKINYTDTRSKEYMCCINGNNHYKTTLLISLKKHVEFKHSEKWDGYCFICKVIVTPQGVHLFKDCLQHFLDKHADNFPIYEKKDSSKESADIAIPTQSEIPNDETSKPPKSYINVRPLSQLLSTSIDQFSEKDSNLPKIESVVSLGVSTLEPTCSTSNYQLPARREDSQQKPQKYEEAQAEVMTKKHRVVLDTMMSRNKLIKVFKCAGRYCSFTSDSAEDALLHASTHQRLGGEKALDCAYCDFDSSGNAIDLVSHVFKSHGHCHYVCGYCFYRAAASQLVSAHITRIHGGEPIKVLKANMVSQSINEDSSNILTREEAVPLYACNYYEDELEEICKFRTYTPGKFYEHLTQRHFQKNNYSCYLCNITMLAPMELIHHMKDHGLKLYQCTWCVHGADTETELLAHASAKHPSKQPQAYLRIITTKDGTSEFRVLPLAQLNKSKVPSEDVTSNINDENPVREAERSIELEKLIGHTTLMIDSMNKAATIVDSINAEETKETENVMTKESLCTNTQRIENVSNTTLDLNTSSPTHSILKSESIEQSPIKQTSITSDVIYCLDSDEEDSKQGIVSLTSDSSASALTNTPSNSQSNTVKIFRSSEIKCNKCGHNFKYLVEFKKHIDICYPDATDIISCSNCAFKSNNRSQLTEHLTLCFSQLPQRSEEDIRSPQYCYSCDFCDYKTKSLSPMNKHVKTVHSLTKVSVTSETEKDGITHYTVGGITKTRHLPKRKSSTGNIAATPAKLKRYGPQDVDQLPINPILEELVYCSLCEFNTKVRLNMVRHLQLHAEQQPVPQTVPVNPVPHLETNEKHFDKMVNLASSSIINRTLDKPTRTENTTTVTSLIPPEAASRYPKYVPDRQRLTCGAKGCSYISVDEGMLRCHWDTLHANTTDYHCVHCPPYQHLDTSKPLTASRIIAHLKMHDVRLYACSACSYYHYKRQVVEKHLGEFHKSGKVLVVREESSPLPSVGSSLPLTSAPTMDLKPWQCGLCKYKSMLRPEVVGHCSNVHNSKMQYKCAYCPFRTSTLENVTKHQSSSHVGKIQEIFYYYYREGSIPDEADGTPRWMKQRQKTGAAESIVKTETSCSSTISHLPTPVVPQNTNSTITAAVPIDLNLVKQEVAEPETNLELDLSIESLCNKFGQLCEPNGLKFKCPLCKVVTEDTDIAMESHLFEELKYRKWGCSSCSYKAFHKTGLNEHMYTEHRQTYDPIQLPTDVSIEKWVASLLEHQRTIIEKNRGNLIQQRIQVEKTTSVRSTIDTQKRPEDSNVDSAKKTPSMKELELAFGQLGVPSNMHFCCPKCQMKFKEETAMQDHLETELTKIRWCCSNCPVNFPTYHEAQFHCKSVHIGQSSRPIEAIRDPEMRSAWIVAVIRVQKLSMNYTPISEPTIPEVEPSTSKEKASEPEGIDNSLLVVRYEERVPTPEEMAVRRTKPIPTPTSTLAKPSPVSPDSDDDKLVIDEPSTGSEVENVMMQKGTKKCPYCDFTSKYTKTVQDHILKHYGLKPFKCAYCDYSGHRVTVINHQTKQHPDKSQKIIKITKPLGPPLDLLDTPVKKSQNDDKEDGGAIPTLVCLVCEEVFTENQSKSHSHDNVKPDFSKKGDIVVKCCICLQLIKDVTLMEAHHGSYHPNNTMNYAFYKLCQDTRKIHHCGHCNNQFRYLNDLKSHHYAVHKFLPFKFFVKPFLSNTSSVTISDDEIESSNKRKSEDNSILPTTKRVAKKSTTKLPKVCSVARKSTTKLPFDVDSDTYEEEYSYYGINSPTRDDLSNITTNMSFCNTMMPFTLKKLSEIINLNPKVFVKDIKKF